MPKTSLGVTTSKGQELLNAMSTNNFFIYTHEGICRSQQNPRIDFYITKIINRH